MRCLLRAMIPVEVGNAAARNGTLGKKLKQILEELKPENAYFVEEQGVRTGYLFLDIPDSSHIPRVAEPFFLAFNARVEIRAAMNVEDLMRASEYIERAAKTY